MEAQVFSGLEDIAPRGNSPKRILAYDALAGIQGITSHITWGVPVVGFFGVLRTTG